MNQVFKLLIPSLFLFFPNKGDSQQVKFNGHITSDKAGVDGLRGPHGMAFTNDGKTLYVSASDGMAVSWFSRDSLTGDLTFIGLIKDGDFPGGIIGQPKSVALTSDEKKLYAGGFLSQNVLWFDRNNQSGQLSFKGDISQFNDNLQRLSGVRNMVLSPDERFLFVTASEGNSVFSFIWNPVDDSLNTMSRMTDGVNGVTDLQDPRPLDISADGKFLYVGNHRSNSILSFTIDSANGILTYSSKVVDGLAGIDGLEGVQSIKLTNDNKHLYVAGFRDNSISWFSRSKTTGVLSYVGIYKYPDTTSTVLNLASAIEISKDGRMLFAGSYGGHSLLWFLRDETTGALTLGGQFTNDINGVEGIKGVEYLLLSPDKKHLYVSGGQSASLAWFEISDSILSPIKFQDETKIQNEHPFLITTNNFPSQISVSLKKPFNGEFEISIFNIEGKKIISKSSNNSASIKLNLSPFGKSLQLVYVLIRWNKKVFVQLKNL